MMKEGPPLPVLLRRLTECPMEFFAAPVINGQGEVHVAAVVCDVLRDLGGAPSTSDLAPFVTQDAGQAARLNLILIACWLLHDDWFLTHREDLWALWAQSWLSNDLSDLSLLVETPQWIADADRREELARRALNTLQLIPQGENPNQAADRLKTLDSVERQRVILETRRAQERARQIREEMARKAAEEAASRYGRE